jgi:hypothetical protein
MYAAQPSGADSATINPAALNTGTLLGRFAAFFSLFLCSIVLALRRLGHAADAVDPALRYRDRRCSRLLL